jgi:hypothetical protein
MSNPFTGGFDVCFEITEDALSRFAAATLGGQEIVAALMLGSQSLGGAHLLIQEASLIIDPDRSPGAVIGVGFRDSSLTVAGRGVIGPLSGAITVTAPFTLSPIMDVPDSGVSDVQMPQLDMSLPDGGADPVTVQVTPDPATRSLLDAALAPFGLDFAAVEPEVGASIRAELADRYGTVPLSGLAFPVTRGGDGSLPLSLDPNAPAEPPRFARLALATLPPTEESRRPGVLCVLAGVLAVPAEPAAPVRKRIAATDSSQRASLTLTPEAFRRHIFCPLVNMLLSGQLGVPPPCAGTRQGFLTVLRDEFRHGYLRVAAAGEQHDTGYALSVTLAATMQLDVERNVLVPRVRIGRPEIDLDIDWWVYVLAAVLLGPITLLVQHLIDQVVEAFETFGQRFLTAALHSVSVTFQDALNRLFGDLTQGVQLRDAAITPQGLFLQLWLPTPPPHRLNPRLGLRLTEDRRDLGTVATGTAKDVTCTHDSYRYTDRREWKIATLTPEPAELGDQVSYAWFANGLPIAPGTGEAFYEATTFDGSRLTRPARVQLILATGGAVLTINHSPPEGNFSVLVRCVATSAAGTQAEAGAQVFFRADQRVWDQQYNQDVRACLQAGLKQLGPGPIMWPPPGDPDPGALRGRVRDRLGPLIQTGDLDMISWQVAAAAALLRGAGQRGRWLERVQAEAGTASRRVSRGR